MSGFNPRLIVAAVCSLAMLAPCSAEPPLQLAPEQGALLMQGGQVILGKITPAGDYYIVSRPHGEIRIPAKDVDLLCKDLEDVYRRKRARIELGKVSDHVELADWCLRNELLDHADSEISYAIAADPEYPRIRLLERRLELARRDVEPLPVSHKAVEQGPTNDELDRFIRGMPSAAVEEFTSTIQPLLVNACTTSGCHGPQSEAKMQLLRIPLGSPPTRRTTQRNLFAVYQQVNPSDAAASPLLLMPTRQHGNAKAAMFTDRHAAQYRELVGWVGQISISRKPARPATVTPPSSSLLQAMPPEPAQPGQPASLNGVAAVDSQTRQAQKPATPAERDERELPDGLPPDAAAAPAPQAERKPRVDDYVPVDPFDPELFNRQYHSDN